MLPPSGNVTPGLSSSILGMGTTRLKSGVAIFPQQASRSAPGIPPRPRPLPRRSHGPWEGRGGHLHGGADDQSPSCSRLGGCSAEPEPPLAWGTPAFWACSLLLGDPWHTAYSTAIPGTKSSLGDSLFSYPALNSCGFCFGLRYCRCFPV